MRRHRFVTLLLEVTIVLAYSGVQGWWDSSWAHRQTIPVKSESIRPWADIPVKLVLDTQSLVSAGNMLSNGADIRITGLDEQRAEILLSQAGECIVGWTVY